jgi:hypothetical protein
MRDKATDVTKVLFEGKCQSDFCCPTIEGIELLKIHVAGVVSFIYFGYQILVRKKHTGSIPSG